MPEIFYPILATIPLFILLYVIGYLEDKKLINDTWLYYAVLSIWIVITLLTIYFIVDVLMTILDILLAIIKSVTRETS